MNLLDDQGASRKNPGPLEKNVLKQDRGKGCKKQARNRALGKFLGKRELVGSGAGFGLPIEGCTVGGIWV